MIYDHPTFIFYNLNQGLFILNTLKNSDIKINLIYPYSKLVWQGPLYLKNLFKKLESSNIYLFADSNNDLGLILNLIRTQIKFIVININDKIIQKKLKNISIKYETKIISKDNFKKLYEFRYEISDKKFQTEFKIKWNKINK
tara:strand:+ start:331 stop:756 length:426 start_codon:yes stop_codon:yes gene_type:complete